MIGRGSTAHAEQARAELSARLGERRAEIEQAVLTRVYAIADPAQTPDPEYLDGLRAAVRAAVGYGLDGIERGEERAPEIPAILLTQARLAARSAISLETVLRRYVAGQALLGDFLVEEAERSELGGVALQHLLRTQATLFDRLVATVSQEHSHEAKERPGSSEQRRVERIERLLDGELIDTSGLEYDFEGHHVGLIASGPGASEATRELAAALDRRLLRVARAEGIVWAWLGGRRPLELSELLRQAPSRRPPQVCFAIGEPGEGLAGWRLTHRQACATLPVARRLSEATVRYADVALLASMLKDNLLATSLYRLFLAPLSRERDGGQALRETLRAYFAAGRNASSAAAAMGVNRDTVANRLRAVEGRLGRQLNSCATEVEAALRLEDLDYSVLPYASLPGG